VADKSDMSDRSYRSDPSDPKDAMAIGYNAAADRIEIEVGLPTGRVLDLGCNTGAGMEALRARWPNADVHGLEPVPEFAQKARDRGFIVATGSAEDMIFPAAYFHFIFSRHSLEHVTWRGQAIVEIRRVLRPGGLLYVQAPIEPDGSPNELHVSPFRSLEEFRSSFPGFTERYWGPQATVAELILEKE
jgi:trans-aconitate methyltransferase